MGSVTSYPSVSEGSGSEEYLVRRFTWGDPPCPKDLARLIHRRTEGHPLFMVNVVEYPGGARRWCTRRMDSGSCKRKHGGGGKGVCRRACSR